VKWRLLETLDEADVTRVLEETTTRRFRRGDVVFHEGEHGDVLHLIASGSASVHVSTPLGDVATIRVLGPGDAFGEMSLVDPVSVRSATIVALEPLETRALRQCDFDSVCKRHPAVREIVSQMLVEHVNRLSAQLLDALYVPADRRVVRRLAELASIYDARRDGHIVVPITQEDLATMAGTTRPTANRTLQELAAAGIVELRRGRFDIVDVAALAERAG